MQFKISSKQTLLTVALVGTIFFIALLLYFFPKNSLSDGSALMIENAVAISNQAVVIDLPLRLKIPKISVDAIIKPVGVNSNGEMGVPKDSTEVAWFNLGPRPGVMGSAVIAGHYNWTNNAPAVFYDLHKLRQGDKIFVEDAQGIVTNFIVREVKTYKKNYNAVDVFSSNDNKAHLNLVTCTGAWNKAEKSYSDRLIVFADMVISGALSAEVSEAESS